MIEKSSKRNLVGLGILMTALAVFQNPAQAEMLHGEVVGVKEDGSSFTFKRSDPSTPSLAEPFKIAVLPDTKFEKISSLQELRAGDVVIVDADKNKKNGTWAAGTIQISKVRLFKE